jgi:hypothetical protein
MLLHKSNTFTVIFHVYNDILHSATSTSSVRMLDDHGMREVFKTLPKQVLTQPQSPPIPDTRHYMRALGGLSLLSRALARQAGAVAKYLGGLTA